MDILAEALSCRFENFLVDFQARAVFRLDSLGVRTRVALGSRAFEILCVLIERRGGLVTKRELLDLIWPNVTVEDNNLTVQIAALRRALDVGRTQGSYVQTITGRGYRLVPEVIVLTDAGVAEASTAEGGGLSGAVAQMPGEARPLDQSRPPRPRLKFAMWPMVFCVLAATLLATWAASRRVVVSDERPRLSLVVLPFENLSGNAAEDYLADGITDDLTSDLTHLAQALVIGNATARTYKGKAVDVRKIGQDLGVRYVVEGSVRRIGAMLRVNAQLISTETGANLWSDRFDEPISDLASGQEEVLARMRDGLGLSLVDIEAARGLRERPTSPDAFDLILRARSIRALPENGDRNEKALALYQQALKLDPDSIVAITGAGYLMAESRPDGSLRSLEQMDAMHALLARGQALAPTSERMIEFTMWSLLYEGHCQQAIPPARQFVRTFPNNRVGYYVLGRCESTLGRPEEEIRLLEKEFRINPYDPYRFNNFRRRGFASLMLGRDLDAIEFYEQSLALSSDLWPGYRSQTYRQLSAAYARSGQDAKARRAAAEADRLWPFDTVRGHYPDELGSPVHIEQIRRYQDGLRLTGERDHADENADFGVPADAELHPNLVGYTPTTAPGAGTIRTDELVRLLEAGKPLALDTLHYSWGRSLPGAIGLQDAGIGGSFTDRAQAQLQNKLQDLTHGDRVRPIVAVGWNAERFDGRNLALRLVAMGFSNVYWYRGGREAWEANGLPEAELEPTEW